MVSRAINIRGLQVAYDELLILKGIDAHVDRGEIAIVLGGSGCGKSTLLKTIIGLVRPQAGRIEVLGEEVTALEDGNRDVLSKRLGVMFQYGALLNSLPQLGDLVGGSVWWPGSARYRSFVLE